jgi:hypothetical protein
MIGIVSGGLRRLQNHSERNRDAIRNMCEAYPARWAVADFRVTDNTSTDDSHGRTPSKQGWRQFAQLKRSGRTHGDTIIVADTGKKLPV